MSFTTFINQIGETMKRLLALSVFLVGFLMFTVSTDANVNNEISVSLGTECTSAGSCHDDGGCDAIGCHDTNTEPCSYMDCGSGTELCMRGEGD